MLWLTGNRFQVRSLECGQDLDSHPSFPSQVHCISTEFTPRKKGGEKGVPFRLQIDTFKPSDKELPLEHLHSAGCLVKVFKVRAARGPFPSLPPSQSCHPLAGCVDLTWLCGGPSLSLQALNLGLFSSLYTDGWGLVSFSEPFLSMRSGQVRRGTMTFPCHPPAAQRS